MINDYNIIIGKSKQLLALVEMSFYHFCFYRKKAVPIIIIVPLLHVLLVQGSISVIFL
jgi:hypothetical protein